MSFEITLDLRWIGIAAADNEHFLGASGNLQITVRVVMTEVARFEPSVLIDGLSGGFLILVIAEHHRIATHQISPSSPIGAASPASIRVTLTTNSPIGLPLFSQVTSMGASNSLRVVPPIVSVSP